MPLWNIERPVHKFNIISFNNNAIVEKQSDNWIIAKQATGLCRVWSGCSSSSVSQAERGFCYQKSFKLQMFRAFRIQSAFQLTHVWPYVLQALFNCTILSLRLKSIYYWNVCMNYKNRNIKLPANSEMKIHPLPLLSYVSLKLECLLSA